MTAQVRTGSEPSEHQPSSRTPSIWRLVSRQTVPIVPFNENGSSPAIYCVHAIAGDVSSFQDLADTLRPAQRFFGIQVPRSKMNAEFCSTIQDVARHHVEAVDRFQPDGPVILAGWSIGAIIALEMAQQLTAAGRDVPLLIALDGAPCNTGAGLRRGTPRYMWRLACNFPGWLRSEIRESSSLVSFLRRIIRRGNERLQTTFPSVRTEQTLDGAAVLRVLGHQGWRNQQRSFIRGLFQASRSYVPSPYRGKVIVYEATVQPLDHLLQVGAVWRKIATQTEVVRLNGNHESIFRLPDVAILAKHLLAKLLDLDCTHDRVEADPVGTVSAAGREAAGPMEVQSPAVILEQCRVRVTGFADPVPRPVEKVNHDRQQLGPPVANGLLAGDDLAEEEYLAQTTERQPTSQAVEIHKADYDTWQPVKVQQADASLGQHPISIPPTIVCIG